MSTRGMASLTLQDSPLWFIKGGATRTQPCWFSTLPAAIGVQTSDGHEAALWNNWVLAYAFDYHVRQKIPGLNPNDTVWAWDFETDSWCADRRPLQHPVMTSLNGLWGVARAWGADLKWFAYFSDALLFWLEDGEGKTMSRRDPRLVYELGDLFTM